MHPQRSEWSRRGLLCAAASTAAAWLANTGGLNPSHAQAAAPISRLNGPHFKLALAAYSFNKLLARGWEWGSPQTAELNLFDVLDFCAQNNLDGAELTSYYFPKNPPAEYIARLKLHAHRLGLTISGTAIGNDFCHPAGPVRDQQLALARDWIRVARDLGAPVIRIFAGTQKKDQSLEEALSLCVAGIQEILPVAEASGVVLGLENHGGITATPEGLLDIVQRVGDSPAFGINFDSGNFRTADPYADLVKIAPHAVNAQIKVEMNPNNAGKVPADLSRVVQILRDAEYRGFVTLEYEGAEPPREAIPAFVSQLRALLM